MGKLVSFFKMLSHHISFKWNIFEIAFLHLSSLKYCLKVNYILNGIKLD